MRCKVANSGPFSLANDPTLPAARQKVQALADAAIGYARRQTTPPIFPMSASDWAPRGRLCDGGQPIVVDALDWEAAPWKELGFRLPDGARSAYQFRLLRSGSASRETLLVEARGDRDCNGITSHFAIAVDAQLVARPLQVERENE